MSTTPTNEDELDNLLWPVISEIVNTPASAFTSNRERISSNVALVKAALSAYIQREVDNARLQMRLHVLSILKAEADITFGNVKQLIYTEHQKAWDDLKTHQLTPPPSKETKQLSSE